MFKRNWLAIFFIVAIVASFFFTERESRQRDDAQAQQLVAGCIRGAERIAYNAAFQYDAADTREATGDLAVAERYRAEADGQVRTMARPDHLVSLQAMTRVVFQRDAHGRVTKAALTPEARALQVAGCEKAFG
jgi:hypothetical protein